MFAKSRQSSQGQESNIIHGMHEIVFILFFKLIYSAVIWFVRCSNYFFSMAFNQW